MSTQSFRGPRFALGACVAALCLAFTPAGAWAAAGAEIVLLVGKGERRQTDDSVWVAAAVKDSVNPGGSVRTLANSQMGILMADRTQVRLNQNSQLQIKSVAEASQWSESTVRLNAGRAWSQARPQTVPTSGEARPAPPARLKMETPTATIGIRGTDWEVEVEPDGRTRVVVLSGAVDVSNDFGAVTLTPGEAALAEAGKAPVRFVLVDPRSRIQWVSAWRPQPQRWAAAEGARWSTAVRRIEAGEYNEAVALLSPAAARDAAAARLLADVLLHQGEVDRAQQVLAAHVAGGRGDAASIALMAHVLARQDRLDEAQALLATALAAHAHDSELQLAAGDIAILQGDAARARAAYAGVLARDPRNVDAWYGLGVIASERERVASARSALGQALQLDPAHGRAQAELAATEAFAGNLAEAERLLQQVLGREPANYQALTALGLVRLQRGQAAAALDDFMKAGLIEPRYSRAQLYSGVAFYQLGERERAMQAFDRAAQLDARDPLPFVYRAIVLNDALDPGAAIESSREAQLRMPFLRSLNQVASNQKGSANLGSSLAGFGLEEWAGYYATQAYSPYWGGSHLFLADRYTGKFNRNSELFKGYLTEPTAFGASNRQSTLVTVPGHYRRIDLVAERTNWNQLAAIATFNGLTVEPAPLAYYASGDFARAEARNDGSTGRARNLTLGLGTKPHYRLGVFAFATDTELRGDLRTASLPDDALVQRERRFDAGFNFKLQPDNQVWVKGGGGSQDNRVAGALVSQELADTLNSIFTPPVFVAAGTLDAFGSRVEQRDLQLRHSFTIGTVQWSWGLERSRQDQAGALATTFTPVRIDIAQEFEVRATDLYAGARYQPGGGHEAQLDLFGQRSRVRRTDTSQLGLPSPIGIIPLENSGELRDAEEINPRAGVQWQLAPLRTVRAVVQRWRRPASVGTLAPVETVGIPLNDRLVLAGGRYERVRLQYDGEMGARSFLRAFADHERIDNGPAGRRTAISDFELTQLENLRNRPDVFAARSDLEETPQFRAGRVTTLGLAFNSLLTKRHALALRYLNRDAEQTGAASGLEIPFVPRHFAQADSQWSFGGQWLLGAGATWRSGRFRDDANTLPLRAGWVFNFTVYWESIDKRSVVQAIVGNLLPEKAAAVEPDPKVTLRYAYRF